ncbi:MAG: cytochrome c oxidase subunit 4 [Paracoccaceae bacterium]|jgi:cytochrome c oxidase subunit 4
MSSTSAASTDVHVDDDHHDGHHILPLWVLLGTWGTLMALTVLTVTASTLELGAFDLPVAMGIATIKAMLVLMIFMHLAFDKGFHSLLIFGSFLFVFLFISFLLIDRGQYQPEITTKTNETLLQGN